MTTTADAYARAIIADMVWTCLGCGDPLPPHRGGYCDGCVEWEPDGPNSPYPPQGDDDNPDPDPAPGRCSYCNDRGPCWECGALDLSALGRKLRYEMRDDRPALLARLRSTPRRFWRVIAHAYALEIGGTPWVNTQPTIPGILWLWTTLERESA